MPAWHAMVVWMDGWLMASMDHGDGWAVGGLLGKGSAIKCAYMPHIPKSGDLCMKWSLIQCNGFQMKISLCLCSLAVCCHTGHTGWAGLMELPQCSMPQCWSAEITSTRGWGLCVLFEFYSGKSNSRNFFQDRCLIFWKFNMNVVENSQNVFPF